MTSCINCTDRYLGCHDNYNIHMTEKSNHNERKELIRNNKNKQNDIIGYEINKCRKGR